MIGSRNVYFSVVDYDHSAHLQIFILKDTSSGYFILTGYSPFYNKAKEPFESDKADLIIEIPPDLKKTW